MNSIEQEIIQESSLDKPKQKQQSVNYNGFTNFPPLTQILPVVYFLFSISETIIVSIENQWETKILILFIFYCCFSLVEIVMWYIVTKIDPTDSIHKLHKDAKQNGKFFDSQSHKFFCRICQTFVSKYSFHCKKCKRCVQMFDHHCKWLNNCIGAKNYIQFIVLVTSTQIFLLFHLAFNILGIITNGPFIWIFYMQILTGLIDFILLIMVSILLGMHIYLMIHKRTTISLIMERRKNNKIHPSNTQVRMIVLNGKQSKDEESSETNLKKQLKILSLKVENHPEKEEEKDGSSQEKENFRKLLIKGKGKMKLQPIRE